MKKRSFAVLIVLLMMVAVSLNAAAEAKPTIRVSLWAAGNLEFRAEKKAVVEELLPHINIVWEDSTAFSNYFSRLLTQMAGGTAPDVIEMNIENFTDYAARNAFLPLSDYMARGDVDFSDFFEHPLNTFNYDGTQYGLPRSFSTVAMYYNKDLLEEAGIEPPGVDTFWTWDEYVANAKALTKGEGNTRQFGVVPGTVFTPYAGAYFPGNGVQWFDPETNTVNLDDPKALEVMERIHALFHEHQVAPGFTTLQDSGAVNLFQTGRVAIIESGPWNIPVLSQGADFEWDIMHRPVMETPATELFANMVGISRTSTQSDAAWEFITTWTMHPDVQNLRAQYMEEIPPVRSVAYSDAFLGNTPPQNIKIFLDAAEYGVEVQAPNWSEIRFGIGPRYLDAMMLGIMSPEETIENLQREISTLINQ